MIPLPRERAQELIDFYYQFIEQDSVGHDKQCQALHKKANTRGTCIDKRTNTNRVLATGEPSSRRDLPYRNASSAITDRHLVI